MVRTIDDIPDIRELTREVDLGDRRYPRTLIRETVQLDALFEEDGQPQFSEDLLDDHADEV